MAVAVVLLACVACAGEKARSQVRFGDAVVTVEIADTDAERKQGLMHRDSLGADAGMLFLMGGPTTSGFWMKNTLIPLSIAYMVTRGDGTYEVVSIRDMEPCAKGDDCPLYFPDRTYDVALEVNQGWFDEHDVAVGDKAEAGGLP